ncbi:hypothetical protein BDZ91DRAFT_720116 [Kalaharituber pfeilii]|nr:hypothetical protein BDZ91DRAFT_720116 [Kalaharituber pfeilii]
MLASSMPKCLVLLSEEELACALLLAGSKKYQLRWKWILPLYLAKVKNLWKINLSQIKKRNNVMHRRFMI